MRPRWGAARWHSPATTGAEVGRQLFVCAGRFPRFDPVLGLYLALGLSGGSITGVAVLTAHQGPRLSHGTPVLCTARSPGLPGCLMRPALWSKLGRCHC